MTRKPEQYIGKTVVTKKGTTHKIIKWKYEPISRADVLLTDSPYDDDSETYDRTYYGEGTWWMYPAEVAEVLDD